MSFVRRTLVLPSFACSVVASACASEDPLDQTTSAETSDATTAGEPTTAGESTSDTSGGADESTGASTVEVSGDAFPFASTTPITTAAVSILELPDTTTVDADGHFVFPALPAGASATFVFTAEGYPTTYTKTFTLPNAGETLERVTFQVPDNATYDLLAGIVDIVPDPATCQIATTVTRVGKSVYDPGAHGEDAATVTIDPALPAEAGPIYFNESVIPDRDLVETSADGGVLFVNVPAGSYTLTATKAGVEFEVIDVVCEGGVLVNASPPNGLQAL